MAAGNTGNEANSDLVDGVSSVCCLLMPCCYYPERLGALAMVTV